MLSFAYLTVTPSPENPSRLLRGPLTRITQGQSMRRSSTGLRNSVQPRATYISEDWGVEGNGHMIMLEQNSDEVANLIIQWIRSEP